MGLRRGEKRRQDRVVPTLLFVRDDAPMASALATVLDQWGIAIDIVTTVADAIARGALFRCEVILCDVDREDGATAEALEAIERSKHRPAVFLMSARVGHGMDATAAAHACVVGSLSAQIDVAELGALIAAAVKQRAAART